MSLEQLTPLPEQPSRNGTEPVNGSRGPTASIWSRLRHPLTGSIGTGAFSNGEARSSNTQGLISTDQVSGASIPLDSTADLPFDMQHRAIHDGSDQASAVVHVEAKQERYPGYRDHPANVIYWSTVVLPKFTEVAERNLFGKSPEQKQEYVAGLVDTYRIIEATPDNKLQQMQAIQRAGLSNNHDYLGQVRGMMPNLQTEKDRILAEAEERSHRQNKKEARIARRHATSEFGKDELALLPEKPRLPLEMVTNLAVLDSMMEIFKEDALDHHPELNNDKGKRKKVLNPITRVRNNESISTDVTGLLTAYLISESSQTGELPKFDADYMGRLSNLRNKIERKREKIQKESSHWNDAQQRRRVLRARRHFNPYSDTISLNEQTGLSEEMIKDVKNERLKEYGKSTAYAATIEGGQIGFGWAFGGGTADFFELKNLVAVAILAGVGRATTSALLYKKQQASENFYEKFGWAPDPATKWTGDRFRKPKLGFALAHWPFEGLYATSTVAAMKVLGTIPGLATEIAADILAIPRQISELIGMKMAVEEIEGSKAKWAWNTAARRLHLPQMVDIRNIPKKDLRLSNIVQASISEETSRIVPPNENGNRTASHSEANVEDRFSVAVPLVGTEQETPNVNGSDISEQRADENVVFLPHAS